MTTNPEIGQALQKLIEGNKRFFTSRQSHPNQQRERRQELVKGQKPFAVIVGCSDSRIPPEIIFDQGLGDLFVVRVAGNVMDDMALASIEYAVDHLGTQLIVVLGHSKCGAVTAVVQGGAIHGYMESIAQAIRPAIDKARELPGDFTDHTIKANARLVADRIRSSDPILSEMVRLGRLAVVSAYYNIESGEVHIL